MPTLTSLLLGLSTTLLSLLGLLLLPHLATLLTPPTILAVLHSTILLSTAFLILLILRHLLFIPINAFHSTACWWYLRYVYLPRFTRLLGNIYRRFRARALIAAAVGGLLIPMRCGFEWDLFLVVTAHWVALLAACVSVEELAAGGEWVVRYWWWCVEVLAVAALLAAF